MSAVLAQAPEQTYTEKLMPAKIGLSESGEISPALAKKLAGKGLGHLAASDLVRESAGKQDSLYAKGLAKGTELTAGLQEAPDPAIAHLPIPKLIRYPLAHAITRV